MKRFFLAVFMAAFVMASYAVPAKRGVVKTLKLVDGTEVTAQLVGDETMHYFVTDDGKKYIAGEDGLYREADMTPDFITFLRHHIAHNDNQRVT